jgi:glycosyltransferase involved in cell wall biosynthesis
VQAPEVSVLVPAFNAAATLDGALRSISRQSFESWECVLVDDGSTDATGAIAEAHARRDPRLRVVHGEHRGLVATLNAGLALCRGRYVARFDADDVMHRDRLALQRLGVLFDAALVGLGCHVRVFPRANLTRGLRAYESWLNSLRSSGDVARDRYVECPLAHPTLFLRKEVLLRYGYRDVPWPEDYDLVLRLLCAGQKIGVVPKRLLGWRDGPSRHSRNSTVYALARFVECKAEFLARFWLAARNDYVLWGYGGTGRALRKALAVHGKHPSHVVELHPRRLGQRVFGAPVIPPEALLALAPRPERIVVSVAGAEARGEIRGRLATMGFAEQKDFVCAA